MQFSLETGPQAIVSVRVACRAGETRPLLAPFGLQTPDQTPLGLSVEGGSVDLVVERNTGQEAALITPDPGAQAIVLTYGFQGSGKGYPEGMFAVHDSRYSRAASDLVQAFAQEGPANGAGAEEDPVARIVQEVHARFVYGHAEVRFNDGLDAVPYLSCGTTVGSCVDINTYLIACLRAAGIEAAYVTGYFFTEERGGVCRDMHCWVVTREGDRLREWDIAHHLKMDRAPVASGLNPKPGCRVALFHSMGLDVPELGIREAKLLAEPVWVDRGRLIRIAEADLQIRMDHGFMEMPFARA